MMERYVISIHAAGHASKTSISRPQNASQILFPKTKSPTTLSIPARNPIPPKSSPSPPSSQSSPRTSTTQRIITLELSDNQFILPLLSLKLGRDTGVFEDESPAEIVEGDDRGFVSSGVVDDVAGCVDCF